MYSLPPITLAKKNFSYPESKEIWKLLEAASVRSHHNTRQVFEDFLTMSVCSLAGGTMEDEYMEIVPRYTEGEKGKRAIDFIPQAFGALVEAMEKTRKDILGDLFQGGVTFGENGQFFTPDHICDVMARMSMDEGIVGKRIFDPACGSGRTLLAAADIAPKNEFYGQDVDLRCVRMTAINLALRNLYGYVIWGNSLAAEQRLTYRTGFNGRGVIAKIDAEVLPKEMPVETEEQTIPADETPTGPAKQLALF